MYDTKHTVTNKRTNKGVPDRHIYFANLAQQNYIVINIYIYIYISPGSTCRLTCQRPDHDIVDTTSGYSEVGSSQYLTILCTYSGDWIPSITDVKCLPKCDKVSLNHSTSAVNQVKYIYKIKTMSN